jgi:hypothetical protein
MRTSEVTKASLFRAELQVMRLHGGVLVRLSPTRNLLASIGVVAASTAALPWVTGYGTDLYQIVVLGAVTTVAGLTSNAYVDRHHEALWAVALLLNVAYFAVPAMLVWALTRVQWHPASAYLLLSWCALYLASLFLFFPATDGP